MHEYIGLKHTTVGVKIDIHLKHNNGYENIDLKDTTVGIKLDFHLKNRTTGVKKEAVQISLPVLGGNLVF